MESADSRLPWLAEVMAANATCQSTLTAKIKAVQLDVGLIRQDKLCSRVTETEQQISRRKDEVLEQSAALRTLQTKVKALEYRVPKIGIEGTTFA